MNNHSAPSVWRNSHKIGLVGLLLAQFAMAYVVGTKHLLTNDSLSLFLPIGITVAIPVTLFLAACGFSPRFRDFILAQDLRILTMMQYWRVVGFVFLPLYAFDVLPGLFAWPAGVGDVLVGLMAAVIVARMDRDPDYFLTSGYRRFHALGLLDFALAIGTSGLASGAFPALIVNNITSAPMDIWPMNIFPSFLVPAFIILQLTALLKVRAFRREATTGLVGEFKLA